MVSLTLHIKIYVMTLKRLIYAVLTPSHSHLLINGIRLIIMLVFIICLIMDIWKKILSFGLYSLFAKKRSLKQQTEKIKYRSDGSVKKQVSRTTDYEEDEKDTMKEE